MKKLIIAITSAFMLFATSAMSMDLRPTVGISGNIGAYAATGIENNYNNDGDTIDETTKEYGAFAQEYTSVFVEFGLNDTISIGLDYVPQTIETPENTNDREAGATHKVKAHIEDLTTIYAKVDLPLGGTYVKIGFSNASVLSREVNASGSTYGDDDTNGPTLGIGYNHEITDGFSIRAEVTASEFSDVKADNGATNKTEIKVEDMIGARGTISLVKAF